MSKNLKNLASLKAADKENYAALHHLIQMYDLSSVFWQKWENKLGDSIKLEDDGQQLHIYFKFKELNDSFQFSTLKSIFDYSVMGLIMEKEEELKLWLLGRDNIIRYFSYMDDSWGQEHLFTQTVSLTLAVIKMFLGQEDVLNKKFKYKSYLIMVNPIDSIIELKQEYPQFSPLWESLCLQ
jgi:hypothetical protein